MLIAARYRSILLTALLFLLLSAEASFAQGDITVSVGNYVHDLGTSISVPIEVLPNGNPISAISLEVTYDSTIVVATDCTISGFIGACNVSELGKVRVSAASTNGLSDDFAIATISFDTVGATDDVTLISIKINTVADSTGNSLPASISNGKIHLKTLAVVREQPLSGANALMSVYLPFINQESTNSIARNRFKNGFESAGTFCNIYQDIVEPRIAMIDVCPRDSICLLQVRW